MSEREDVERILKGKKRLEKRIERLESELADLRGLDEVMGRYLAEKSFKTSDSLTAKPASAPKQPFPPGPREIEPPSAAPPFEQGVALTAMDGVELCTLYSEDNQLRIVPAGKLKFKVSTPPFQQFLINKVLNNMAAQDREDAIAGVIGPDEILSYRIDQDGDVIKEITIKNVRDEKRAGRLKNSIRWTLEKMKEKMNPPSLHS